MDLESLKSAVESGGALLVDVREAHEWQAGHLAGALHLPLSTLASNLPQLPEDKIIYLYCSSGGRVFPAAAHLKQIHPSIIPLKWGFQELARVFATAH